MLCRLRFSPFGRISLKEKRAKVELQKYSNIFSMFCGQTIYLEAIKTTNAGKNAAKIGKNAAKLQLQRDLFH